MTDDRHRFAPPGGKGLADLAKEPGFVQRFATYSAAQGRIISAPFEPLRTPKQIDEGVAAGAAATFPMVIMHGLIAVAAVFSGDWRALAVHGGLALLAILTAYAILAGRSRWPTWFALGWVLFELILARRLLGYDGGQTILHVMVLPPAILGVRAVHRRASLMAASQAP